MKKVSSILLSIMVMIGLLGYIMIMIKSREGTERQEMEKKAYQILSEYAKELAEMRGNIRKLDEAIAETEALPRDVRARAVKEMQEALLMYQRLAARYNDHMAEWSYRFADSARLPKGVKPLPRAFDLVIPLRSMPQV